MHFNSKFLEFLDKNVCGKNEKMGPWRCGAEIDDKRNVCDKDVCKDDAIRWILWKKTDIICEEGAIKAKDGVWTKELFSIFLGKSIEAIQ